MLPAAEGDGGVAVVEPAARYVRSLAPRPLAVVRLALRVIDMPRPQRFSRLPLDARVRRLEKLDRSLLGRELVLLLKSIVSISYCGDPRVGAAVGWEPGCSRRDDAPASGAPPLAPALMEPPWGDTEHCDVVVVGSGAGGAVAAHVLAEAGLSVIVVEEGDYHDAASYPDSPIEAFRTLYRDGGLLAAEGRPVIPLPVGRAVGGTTVINSGTCFRAPDWVLAPWREEHGIGWATSLEREFEAAEQAIGVVPVDPVPVDPVPVDPVPVDPGRTVDPGRNGELCRAGADALGFSNGPITRNAPGVTRCARCNMGCSLDAKLAMHVSELPRAVAAGARVRSGVRVVEVTMEAGHATGVRCEGEGGDYAVSARSVVLAAGAIGTPELLLRQGLANSSRQVGRNLHIHPACWVGARFDEQVRGWEGIMQSWSVDEWRRSHGLFLEATSSPLPFGMPWLRGVGPEFRERVERYGEMGIVGVHLGEHTSSGRVTLNGGRARVRYRLSRDDADRLRFGIARAADIHFAAGAREVYPQIRWVASLAPGEQTRLERGGLSPADLRLEAFHPMGSARMGSDPGSSVVAPTGETHDVPGLHIADASILPTSLSVNPMITIMACARRIASGLADRLG